MSPPGKPLAVAEGIDWRAFIVCVRHHRVALRLTIPASLPIPNEVCRELEALRRNAAQQGLMLCHALIEIAKAFRAADIPMLAIKGPAFAALIYSDPRTRAARDLDLLVERRHAARAASVLVGLGYAALPARTEPECLEYSHSGTWPRVEVHTALSSDDRLLPAALLRPFDGATQVMIHRQRIDTLAPEAAVIFAAVHGCRHLWSRLFWVADLAAAAQGNTVDWEAAFALARRMGVERHLTLGLVLARDCLRAPLPAAAMDGALLARAEAAALPLRHVLTATPLLDRDALYRIGLLRSLWWSSALYSHPAGRLAVLQEAMSVTDDDRRLVDLPPVLTWLYLLLRPFRILCRRLSRWRALR